MDPEWLRNVLGWCTLINMGALILWLGMWMVGRDWIYAMHSRYFKLSPAQFDAAHYNGMALYKLAIFLFNLVPYLALRIAG